MFRVEYMYHLVYCYIDVQYLQIHFLKHFYYFLAPRHIKGFCENPEVVNAFKAAALGRPVNLQSSTGMYIYKFHFKLIPYVK